MVDGHEILVPEAGSSREIATEERVAPQTAVALWIASYRSPNTRRAYRQEIDRFCAFLARSWGADQALERYLSLSETNAHAVVDAYRTTLLQKSPSSVNRSMVALNSFAKSCKRHGLIGYRLEAKMVQSDPYRDTRGPGIDGVKRLLAEAKAERKDVGLRLRNVAMIRLLFGMGLRRAELCSIDIEDVDLAGSTIAVVGKGRAEKRKLTLPSSAAEAVRDLMAFEGRSSGPLFVSLTRKTRLGGESVYHIVTSLARRAGISARPHGLRHAAITAVLDATGGDMRKAKIFGRHARADTTALYDDNRQDLGGSASRIIDALID